MASLLSKIIFATRLYSRERTSVIFRSIHIYNIIFLGRSPHDSSANVIDGMVKKTLSSLGLTEVRKNRIGPHFQRGISGGQKRRVTIASSVVTQPQILLCDEPTSGLGTMAGYQVASASELRSYFRMSQSH
jgi:ABC-type multidrug transport system ATPase subunit